MSKKTSTTVFEEWLHGLDIKSINDEIDAANVAKGQFQLNTFRSEYPDTTRPYRPTFRNSRITASLLVVRAEELTRQSTKITMDPLLSELMGSLALMPLDLPDWKRFPPTNYKDTISIFLRGFRDHSRRFCANTQPNHAVRLIGGLFQRGLSDSPELQLDYFERLLLEAPSVAKDELKEPRPLCRAVTAYWYEYMACWRGEGESFLSFSPGWWKNILNLQGVEILISSLLEWRALAPERISNLIDKGWIDLQLKLIDKQCRHSLSPVGRQLLAAYFAQRNETEKALRLVELKTASREQKHDINSSLACRIIKNYILAGQADLVQSLYTDWVKSKRLKMTPRHFQDIILLTRTRKYFQLMDDLFERGRELGQTMPTRVYAQVLDGNFERSKEGVKSAEQMLGIVKKMMQALPSEVDEKTAEFLRFSLWQSFMHKIVTSKHILPTIRRRQCLYAFRDMVDSGLPLTNSTCTMIMDMYSRLGDSHTSLSIWNRLNRNTSLSFSDEEMKNGLKSAPSLTVEDHFTLSIAFDMIQKRGYGPSDAQLSVIIDNLGFNGPLPFLNLLWQRLRAPSMRNPFHSGLELNHYNSMIEALARNGFYHEAWEVFIDAQEVGQRTNRWKTLEKKTVNSLLTFVYHGDRPLFTKLYNVLKSRWPHLTPQISPNGKLII